jgi:hypothetical protein
MVGAPPAHAAPCDAPANAIVAENCKPGASPGEWEIADSDSTAVQGFATDISVDQGATIGFKISANASYALGIYRLGWYGGAGARKVGDAVVQPGASSQPPCDEEAATGLVHCENWTRSATWTVPAAATSGIYLAVATQDGVPVGHIVFVVRDDDGRSDLLFQTADTTWQAYNRFGGNSLYTGNPVGRAYKVSYDRPFTTARDAPEDWLFNSEYPMVRWLERNGFDVSYFTGVDSDRLGAELQEHRVFLSVGHDEYWSGGQRANVEAARDAGVNLAFFSGNEVFWKTRWEDGHRTLVSYKETRADEKIDPTGTWTGTWRDARPFNPEGPQPENALTGTWFKVNYGTRDIEVPAADGKLRFWRGTRVANLAASETATLAQDTLGYEWDEDPDNGARPAGLVRLSTTTASGVDILIDHGSSYESGSATHHLTLYRDPNGAGPDALVFGAGTIQWPWGLDPTHVRGGGPADPAMQQATVNLFADMHVQPASPDGVQVASASTDRIPPSVAITSPATITVTPDSSATVEGTAADVGGGRVGAVEVSVDGGASWHPASGRETWQYTWTPTQAGTVTPLARASDDSGNLLGAYNPSPDGDGSGTPGAGAGPPAQKPSGRGARTAKLTIRSRRVRMSRRGIVKLRVACRAGGPDCRVRLRLKHRRRSIARRTATVRSGTERRLRLRLDRAARRKLIRKGTLRVVAVAAGSGTTTRATIRLIAPRKR